MVLLFWYSQYFSFSIFFASTLPYSNFIFCKFCTSICLCLSLSLVSGIFSKPFWLPPIHELSKKEEKAKVYEKKRRIISSSQLLLIRWKSTKKGIKSLAAGTLPVLAGSFQLDQKKKLSREIYLCFKEIDFATMTMNSLCQPTNEINSLCAFSLQISPSHGDSTDQKRFPQSLFSTST